MMNRFLTCFVIAFLAVGCRTFDVVVKDDPFKGTTVVTADMWHTVTDARIDNRRVLYQKEIVKGKVLNPTASFEFGAQIIPIIGYQGAPLGNEVYILCDTKNFIVKLLDNNTITQTMLGSHHRTDAQGQASTKVQTTTMCALTGRITLTPDIQKAIQNCQSYQIRFTTGNDNLTLKATPAQLEAVKKFIAINTLDAGKKK
jgi:hypothetical protein